MDLSETKINKGVLKRLSNINIHTVAELKKNGPIKAYFLMQAECKNTLPKTHNLYDPAAIVLGLENWQALSQEQKTELNLKLKRMDIKGF